MMWATSRRKSATTCHPEATLRLYPLGDVTSLLIKRYGKGSSTFKIKAKSLSLSLTWILHIGVASLLNCTASISARDQMLGGARGPGAVMGPRVAHGASWSHGGSAVGARRPPDSTRILHTHTRSRRDRSEMSTHRLSTRGAGASSAAPSAPSAASAASSASASASAAASAAASASAAGAADAGPPADCLGCRLGLR